MQCSDVVLWVENLMSRVLKSLVVESRCSDVRCRAEYLFDEFRSDIGIIL